MNSTLEGKLVVVTRPKNHGGKLVAKLKASGAVPMLLPATEIADPADVTLLDHALLRLDEFDWIVFTSANGVEAVVRRFSHLGLKIEDFPKLKIAVVGPATGAAIAEAWREPDAMPKEFVSDEIASIIPDLPGKKILLARGDLARLELSGLLAYQGASVLDVVAYRIVSHLDRWEVEPEVLPDVITVMSGESARATIRQLRDIGLDEWLEKVPIACIGPITAASVVEEGIKPAAVAQEHTVEGLVRALEEMFQEKHCFA